MVAEPIHHVRLLPLALLLTGCFYTDPINQRPSADIQQESSVAPFRGDFVDLTAVATDPENQQVDFSWRVYACTDATAAGDCDAVPFLTGLLTDFTFQIPVMRVDVAKAVESLLVIMEATDELGAVAKPDQQLVIPVADHPPNLMLSASSRFGYVTNTPIQVFAQYGDVDDGAASTTIEWKVFTPMQPDTFVLADPPSPVVQDPASPDLLAEKVLTPDGVGDWSIEVTATDPLGAITTQTLPITVTTDQPPCLEQWQPIAPFDGTSVLPITEPTLFQIPVVVDDLDVYPPLGDPILGVATFAWSILPPGASVRQPLANTGNSVDFDPATYRPGDIVELRVDISDRVPRATCTDSDLTCALNTSLPTCYQRMTWRVEVH
jgi:hypothetical protein